MLTFPKGLLGINYHLSLGIKTPITPDNKGIYIYALVYVYFAFPGFMKLES